MGSGSGAQGAEGSRLSPQGNSIAGKRAGNDDPRSGLIFRVLEIVKEAAPSVVLLENTPTALKSSMRLILERLKGDYDISWRLVSAEDVGYLHKCVARAAAGAGATASPHIPHPAAGGRASSAYA